MTQLENRIQRVPQRDFLIVAGDFNAHAVTERPHIGPSVPHRVRFANADVKTLPSLCKSCGLTALNTWASGHRSTYTNSDGTYSSQIDFMLVRLHDARRRSKEAYSDKNFPVAAPTEMDQNIFQCELLCSFLLTVLRPASHGRLMPQPWMRAFGGKMTTGMHTHIV